MDDNIVMLRLIGHSPLVQQALQLKGIPFERQPGPDHEVVLETRSMSVWDEDTIIQYLDERFPIPQLINGDVENRARIRMVSKAAAKDEQICEELAKDADPFVFGSHITLADLVVYQHSKNQQFRSLIEKVIRKASPI